jgi:hypothetical protein
MKILYISSWHSVLEYDDLSMLSELGASWFSTGHYCSEKIHSALTLRPQISKGKLTTLLDQFYFHNNHLRDISKYNTLESLSLQSIKLTPEFINNFDLVFISNNFKNILHNLKTIKIPIVWRSYGNQNLQDELLARELKTNLKFYTARMFRFEEPLGMDYYLPNHVDKDQYLTWLGENKICLTFQNHLGRRAYHRFSNGSLFYPEYLMYLTLTSKIPHELYGLENEVPTSKGPISWEEQRKKLQTSRVYLSLPARPAPYTYNAMEAMMAGCPIVTFGSVSDIEVPIYGKTYKLHNIIKHNINGCLCNTMKEFHRSISNLMENMDLAKEISCKSRETAIELFDKEISKVYWKKMLMEII